MVLYALVLWNIHILCSTEVKIICSSQNQERREQFHFRNLTYVLPKSICIIIFESHSKNTKYLYYVHYSKINWWNVKSIANKNCTRRKHCSIHKEKAAMCNQLQKKSKLYCMLPSKSKISWNNISKIKYLDKCEMTAMIACNRNNDHKEKRSSKGISWAFLFIISHQRITSNCCSLIQQKNLAKLKSLG